MRETPHSIVNALKQRAQAVLNDRSIDAESRAIIRYALETNDPLLSEFVRRADAGETIVDEAGYLNISNTEHEVSRAAGPHVDVGKCVAPESTRKSGGRESRVCSQAVVRPTRGRQRVSARAGKILLP